MPGADQTTYIPNSAPRARSGLAPLRRKLQSTSKSSSSFFRSMGANIFSNRIAPMPGFHPCEGGKFRRRQYSVDRALRDEILHIGERHSPNPFSLQRNSEVTANIDCILGPFLPAAFAAIRQMQ